MRMVKYCAAALTALLVTGCGDPRTSYEREADAAAAAAIAQSQPSPAELAATEAERAAEVARWERINAIRRADPALNWLNIGITTDKFSESLSSEVYKTFKECAKSSWMEDNECIPIPALPDSYWAAGEVG
jgi:hypothetical protein